MLYLFCLLIICLVQNYPTVDFDFRNAALLNKRNAQGDHAALIRRIGAESNILLKHINNVLPFSSNISGQANYTFAVIGSDAGTLFVYISLCFFVFYFIFI
jgi:beta-glucosidase